MTSSVSVLKAVVSHATVPPAPGGWTESPWTLSVILSAARYSENNLPIVLRSDPLCGTICPLRCDVTVASGGSTRSLAVSAVKGVRIRFVISRFSLTSNKSILKIGQETNAAKVDAKFWEERSVRKGTITERNERAEEGMTESVEMVIPPAGSSEGSWKLLIVMPGRPLNAFKVIVFDIETPLKMVPRAVSLREEVEIVQAKLGLCSK